MAIKEFKAGIKETNEINVRLRKLRQELRTLTQIKTNYGILRHSYLSHNYLLHNYPSHNYLLHNYLLKF